jgi:hypothetical protein
MTEVADRRASPEKGSDLFSGLIIGEDCSNEYRTFEAIALVRFSRRVEQKPGSLDGVWVRSSLLLPGW